MTQIDRYIRSIRNARKQEYAAAYVSHLLYGEPEPSTEGLSYMAAQAVRLNIRDMAR